MKIKGTVIHEPSEPDSSCTYTVENKEDERQYICINTCKNKNLNFIPSKVGAYWLNDYDGDTQIDVCAIDQTNKIFFAGECKYHVQPVDADVYFDLKKKVDISKELQNTFNGYHIIYGVFSKSGFTERLLDLSSQNEDIKLFNCERIL